MLDFLVGQVVLNREFDRGGGFVVF